MAQQNTNGKRKSTIKKVWHYLKNYRFLLILSILMAALTVAGTLYVPILVGDAIDFIIKKRCDSYFIYGNHTVDHEYL